MDWTIEDGQIAPNEVIDSGFRTQEEAEKSFASMTLYYQPLARIALLRVVNEEGYPSAPSMRWCIVVKEERR